MLDEMKLRPYLCMGYPDLSELYKDMGRKDESFKHLKKAEKVFKEMGMEYWLGKIREVLERV